MRMTQLSRFFGVKGGTTPSTANSDYWGGDIPWVTPADMKDGAVETLFDTRAKVTSLAVEESSLLISQPGWLILSNRAPIGKVAICGTRMCTNQGCKLIYPLHHVEYSTRFLAYWFLAHKEQLNSLGAGTTFLEISAEKLLSFSIPVVSYDLQCKIVDEIEEKTQKIDFIIKNKNAVLNRLKEYRQSLITRAVTKGLNPDVRLCDSGVVWIGKIPQHWSVCAVKWLTDITSGGTPDRTNKEYWTPGTIPWIKTGELQNNTITESEEKISLLGMKNSAAKLFPVETLLVAMYGATRGMTGLLQIPATTNQACAALMIKKQEKRIIPNFLQYVFMAGCDFVRQKAVGAGQPNLSLDLIANLKVPVPPFEEQELIVKRLRDECGRVDDTIVKVTDVISKLSEYRSSLIADVLAGKGMAKGVSHV